MLSDIFITLFLVFLNGFFVAAEFAIVKVRSSQLEIKAKKGHRVAILAKHITTHLDGYLAATQLGITLASLGLGWIGEPVVSKIIISIMDYAGFQISPELAHDIALPIAFGIITVLHIVFGELAPKSIALQRSESTTLAVSYPLQFFFILFKPIIWVLNGIANFLLRLFGISAVHGSEVHSSDELKYLVMQGKESGAIEQTNYDIIKNAFNFSEHTAKQVMVPRTLVTALDLNDLDDASIEAVILDSYSRIPCYEDNLDNIVGIVYLKDILLNLRKEKSVELRKILRPVPTIPETKRIGQLLKDFQVRHQQMAIVVDEYGGTTGIVTMEDILEELVGEIQDEFDNEIPIVEKMGDNQFVVLASSSLDDINDHLPYNIERSQLYDTLAGYLINKFGRIPNTNEKISDNRYEYVIKKNIKNTIKFVEMRILD